VTNNIFSHSGIDQEVDLSNVVRFVRANGQTIPQSQSTDVHSTQSYTTSGNTVSVSADRKEQVPLARPFW
jgi:hypothetical protein